MLHILLSLFSVSLALNAGNSVSGLSSGGFFAVQYEFAYSSETVGAGIFAGGPYYCAEGLVANALTTCTQDPDFIFLSVLEAEAAVFASRGLIDPLSNLKNHNVFLFSGENDHTVVPGVMKKLEQMYQDYGVKSVTSSFDTQAGHSFPTTNFGNPCGTTNSPYITNCGYDGAGAALKAIYGPLKAPVAPVQKNLRKSSLTGFIPSGSSPSDLSLDETFYYYLPTSCISQACSVHVTFHGCEMTYDDIQLDYVNGAGFNGWAESNGIIIVYPFTTKSLFGPTNPEGCWDWWGYDDFTYATQTGGQVTTIHNLVCQFFNHTAPCK